MKTYDLTLRGYSEAHNLTDGPDELTSAADVLVKWINAPSLKAVKKFIKKNDLEQYCDEPYPMISKKEADDGVDLVLDNDGYIVEEMFDHDEGWRQKWLGDYEEVQTLLKKHRKPKVVISVSGGVVQGVYTDADVQVLLFDWDDIEDEDNEQIEGSDDDDHVYPTNPLSEMPFKIA